MRPHRPLLVPSAARAALFLLAGLGGGGLALGAPPASADELARHECLLADHGGVELGLEELVPDRRFRWTSGWRPAAAPRWVLALGGGGAWGIAHLGFLEAMENDGLVPDAVAGTSAGALVGAFYASGMSPADIEDVLRASDWNEMFTRTPRLTGESSTTDPLNEESALVSVVRLRSGRYSPDRGLVPDRALNVELYRYLAWAGATAGNDLDRLPIPFRAVTTDLDSGTTFAPRHVSLPRIVRASIGLPIFAPIVIDERILVDGGLLENVPTRVARGMADVVIAAQLTREGRSLGSPPSIWSPGHLFSRGYEVAAANQRRADLGSADTLINIAVGDVSAMDFHGHIDELLEAGRAAWFANREALLAALEAKARDTRSFRVEAIEADDAAAAPVAREMDQRLGIAARDGGGGPRPVSALRLELELVRVLRGGRFTSGSFEIRPDGRAIVHLVPATPVRFLDLAVPEPMAAAFANVRLDRLPAPAFPATVTSALGSALARARRAGFPLAGIRDVRWDAATGRMTVSVEQGTLTFDPRTAVEHAQSEPAPERSSKPVRADMQSISREFLPYFEQGGGVPGAMTLDLERETDGNYRLTAWTANLPSWKWAFHLGLSDQLGASAWTSVTMPALTGMKHWSFDARFAIWRLGAIGGLEAAPPSGPFFTRIVASRPMVPQYTQGGDLEGSRPYRSAAIGLGLRTPRVTIGQLEVLAASHWVDDAAFVAGGQSAPKEGTHHDLSLSVRWSGDRRDDPRQPTLGVAWDVTAIEPIAGSSRPRLASGDLSLFTPLLHSRGASIGLLLRGATAAHDRPLSVDQWTDVGSWWEAPRMLPGRGLSPEVRRGTLVARANMVNVSGLSIACGASAAAWSLGDVRIDPTVPASGRGFSIFADANYGRFGPLTLGLAWGSLGGNTVFILISPVRVPGVGPGFRLPGR